MNDKDSSIKSLLSEDIKSCLKSLNSDVSGLTHKDAKERLKIFGHNEFSKIKKYNVMIDFLSRFKNPLILILLFAGAISGFLHDLIEAGIIFFLVFFSIFLTWFMEFKANKALEELKEKIKTTANVLRDDVLKEIKISELVPGDIIELSAGDMIPADARIIEEKDFFVNQSALTGESFPIEKTIEKADINVSNITEWKNCIFLGTSVVSGTAKAVVINTGSNTEYGKLAKEISSKQPETEFEKGLKNFSFLITKVVFFLVLFVFLTNSVYKSNILESFLFAIALAVGLTPELLPMIMTVNLSKGALEMSKKGVIVKRLASIQNFGSMDILCSDKTGTLTENKIELVLHIDLEGRDNQKILLYSLLNSHFQTGLKSPLDDAINSHKEIDIKLYSKIDEIPFDFNRKRVSVVVEKDKEHLLIVKGAPEEVIKVCSFDKKERAIEKYNELSSKGFKVIAVAYKSLNKIKKSYNIEDEKELNFLGFVAFIDPPKEDSKEALKSLKESGVELKILTGDNELVTKFICEKLGFEIKGVLLGNEIEKMRDEELIRKIESVNIFARVNPLDKNRIIRLLKNKGHVVGFLGDGINDAISMKTADVGISVSNAVDVAKESADIILSHKSLMVLKKGVIEGRRIFGNTMKYIMMGTSSNFGNMFSVAGASMFLPFLPMLPVQILLNNLLYDASQLTIPSDYVDKEYIEKPKKWNINFIKKFMLVFGPISSVFDFITFFVMLYIFNASSSLFQTAWFIESMFTQIIVIFVIRTRKVPFYKSRPSNLLMISCFIVLAFNLILPFTPLGAFFKFAQLPALFFLILTVIVLSYISLVEIIKSWFYKKYSDLY